MKKDYDCIFCGIFKDQKTIFHTDNQDYYRLLGLYAGLVLLFSRLIRSFLFFMAFRIVYTEMPYVDRVLQLCLDIYLVREAGQYSLEEDLFSKLIFLFRSPETMIKYTKHPENRNMETDI